MHLFIYFCGSTDIEMARLSDYLAKEAGYKLESNYEKLEIYYQNKHTQLTTNHKKLFKHEEIYTLVIKGCKDPAVCDGYLFPDLENFAERFAQFAFLKQDNAVFPSNKFLDENLREQIGVCDINAAFLDT